jgi:glycosyltransferase involved in cell wall biosynthesis/GT2 family glycosyltransferase
MNIFPKVTVIVPVHNAEQTLVPLLEALLHQTYPKEYYEIILVDNNSEDKSREIIKRYPVTLLEERSAQSSYAARNTGIQHAHHDILAFTDADCVPQPSWLMEGVTALQKNSVFMAGGPIEFTFSRQKTSSEIFDSLMNLDYLYWKRHGVWATANLFVKKHVFERLGLFPAVPSGGDMQWTSRAIQEGYHLVFASRAIVYHPARPFDELMEKSLRIGQGAPSIWFAQGYRWGYAFLKILRSFIPPNIITLINKINQRGTPDMKRRILTLWFIGYIYKVIRGFGYLSGLKKYKQQKKMDLSKKNLNVLIGILKYPPDFTGAGQRIHQLYKHLKKKGVQHVYVLTTSPSKFRYRQENIEGIEVHLIGGNHFIQTQPSFRLKIKKAWYIASTILKVIGFYRRFSYSIDVVHTIDSSWFSTLIAYLARFSGKPLLKEIVLLGSDDPLTLKKKVFQKVFLFPFQYARKIVVISEPLKTACLKAGIPENKIWCRHNPVYSQPEWMEKERIIPKESDKTVKTILWVGKVSPRKNLEFLLKSGAYLEGQVRLTFIGPVGDEPKYFQKLMMIANSVEAKTKGRIKIEFIKESLSHDELSQHYLSSDLFWFASLKEGMGNVVAESLVYGTPVITLPVDGIMELLLTHPEDGEIVPTKNPRQFAEVVNEWLSREHIDRNSISERAKEVFNPDKVENGYIHNLKECVRPA